MSPTTQKVVNIILKGLKEKQAASEKAVRIMSERIESGKIDTEEAKEILDVLEEYDANTKAELAAVKKLSKL